MTFLFARKFESIENTCSEACVIYHCHACLLSHFIRVQLFVTLWTVAHQALLSMGFSRQEHWNVLLCLAPGDLPDRGIIPISLVSHALTGEFFTISTTWLSEPPGKLYQMPINLN